MYGYPYEGACDIIISVPPELELSTKIYPNPVRDILTIDPGFNIEYSFAIYSLTNIFKTGSLVLGKQVINIQSYPPGIYFLEFKNAEGFVFHKTNFIKM